MIPLIDSIFGPILSWLNSVIQYLDSASVPAARPLKLEYFLGPFTILGPGWTNFVKTALSLLFLYCLIYVVKNGKGLYQQFKDAVKWW